MLDTAGAWLFDGAVSTSTLDDPLTRQTIMTWRDEATLSALELVHEAAVAALRTFDAQLDAVTLATAVTSADTVARDLVRPAMRETLRRTLDPWFDRHARALRRIGSPWEPLALRFAAMAERPPLPRDAPAPVAAPSRWSAPAWLRGSVDTIGSALDRTTAEIAARALPDAVRDSAGQVTARIGREVGERSGAHDRLRAAARVELTATWTGPAHDEDAPRPYLSQLLDRVDHTARQALEIRA